LTYSKNYLIVAPGLIVYERLLDSYLGKEREDGTRDFFSSDFFKSRELFIPDAYREEVLGFVQSSVVRKEEIGRKITGDGLIAITNFHKLFDKSDDEADEDVNPRVNSFELAAVDRNARLAEQLKAPAQHQKLTTDLADRRTVVLAEIGYRFEIRHQAAGQPDELDVALALPLKAPARLDTMEVSVDVDFQQRCLPVACGSTPPNPSLARSSSSTKTSIARTGLSSPT
jgi:hypothetical protein